MFTFLEAAGATVFEGLRIKSPDHRLISICFTTTSNRPYHALPIYVLMACIKSVFLPLFSLSGVTGGCLSQLAQFVRFRTMRPTVDNVYSRRSLLYPKTLIPRVYLLRGIFVASEGPSDVGFLEFPISLPQYFHQHLLHATFNVMSNKPYHEGFITPLRYNPTQDTETPHPDILP